MSAFCGWLAAPGNDLPPSETLGDMAAAFRGRRFESTSVASPSAAAWVTTAVPRSALCDSEEPWVVVVGSPRWRDPLLAEVQRAQGPAKALRRAYRDHGIGLFDQIAGAFAFAVLDRSHRRALLAIDRMGIHSLYYSEASAEELVFGTTADMVRAHPRIGASVPLQAIYNYLHAFVCRSPGTIYAEQRKLGPAQYLLTEDGRSRVGTYWRTPFAPDLTRSPEELQEELVAQLRRAVRNCVAEVSAESTGAFLSGGLDSSTVAGLLNEVTPGPAETFTIGFDEASYDEMRYAEAATRRFGTRAHRYYLTAEDTAEMAPKVAAYYDEPFGNSSALPAFFCAAQAQDAGMTCLLAGDGGDEILAGNSRYLEQADRGPYTRLPPPLRAALKLASFHTPLLRNTVFWRKAQGYIARAEMALPERLEAYNFYQVDRMSEVFDADSLRELDLEAPWRDMRQTYEAAASSDALQRMMHLDLKQALADADLKKVQGMCDLARVDVRFPFLDDDLVAFCATIPPELHLRDGRLRGFYKDAFRDFLPAEVIDKKKHGFGMPFYEWTRDHPRLRDLAYDSLGSLRRRHLFRDDFIERVTKQHGRTEATVYDGLVWDLMMLELWYDSHGF
jgi:asparagine synthase (glutamine-hydrolysing)